MVVRVAAGDDAGDDKVWAQVEGKKEFLKLAKYVAKNLRLSLSDMKDKGLFVDAKPESVTMLQTSPEDGGLVRVERKEGVWSFIAPKSALTWAADPADALRTIVTAKVARFAAPEDAEASAAALAKPEFAAQLVVKGIAYTLTFGPKITVDGPTKNKRWASLEAGESPASEAFLIADFTATRFRKEAAELRRKKLFDFDKAAIASIDVAWPDGKTKVALEKGAAGALVPATVPQGKKPAARPITAMVTTLTNLRAKSFVLGKKADELGLDPKVAYIVMANVGDGKVATLLISRKTEGTDPYATVDFGPLKGHIFTLNKYQVDNLQKGPNALIE